jgi:hypothetical protein
VGSKPVHAAAGVDVFPSWYSERDDANVLDCRAPGALDIEADNSLVRRHAQKAHTLCVEDV